MARVHKFMVLDANARLGYLAGMYAGIRIASMAEARHGADITEERRRACVKNARYSNHNMIRQLRAAGAYEEK